MQEEYKNNIGLQVIPDSELFDRLLSPVRDLVADCRAGSLPWCKLTISYVVATEVNKISFDGANFKGLDLSGMIWGNSPIKNCDFSDSDNVSSKFAHVEQTNFDNANLNQCQIRSARNCSFRNAALNDAQFATIESCSFDRASMTNVCFRSTEIGGNTSFRDCNLEHANLNMTWVSWVGQHRTPKPEPGLVDFSNANLVSASLCKAQLPGVVFRDANLSGADLSDADLSGADLTNANLSHANLFKANLESAKLAGANFTNANLCDTKLDGAEMSTAAGLKESLGALPACTFGVKVSEFEKVLSQSNGIDFELAMEASWDEPSVYVTCTQKKIEMYARYNSCAQYGLAFPSLREALTYVFQRFWMTALKLEKLSVKSSKCPLSPKELKPLVSQMLQECFSAAPQQDDRKAQLEAAKDQKATAAKHLAAAAKQKAKEIKDERDGLLMLLRGEGGVEKWNAKSGTVRSQVRISQHKMSAIDFEKIELTKLNLAGVLLFKLNLKGSQFSDSDLSGAMLFYADARDTSFENADLTKANAEGTDFRKAKFCKTNLTQANLSSCDLRGADFSDAQLDGCDLSQSLFDENTVFSPSYIIPDSLEWKSKELDPRVKQRTAAVLSSGPVDFEKFMQNLSENFDTDRLKKATQMLKKETFQLFVAVSDKSMVGIVKSQTDPDLTYSCKLTADGHSSCGTQNLNACGGLRGSLCKHLLVLLIGTTKADMLEPESAIKWVIASKTRKPAIDKDTITDTFLKYKGAEAGDIDWRPIETIPEDYYAF